VSAAEAPFRRAIVALNGGALDDEIVGLAIEAGRGRKVELVGVHVIEVDWAHALTEDLASGSDVPQRILDGAEASCEVARVPMATVLLQAREVGPAIVDEAVQRDADLIVVGLPYRRRLGGDFDQGKTVPYVLANAPMQVWVVRGPQPDGSGEEDAVKESRS
jgi:nucleotide-binding universal stress UspA family protein